MQKLLLFSHNGFSDTGANGITMKNLLSAWLPEEKAEFYCDVEKPDFSAAHHYFRVSDSQMIKALLGKKSQHVFTYSPEQEAPGEGAGKSGAKATKKIPGWLKKYKYNFCLKWAREYLWMLSPWGHRELMQWIRDFDPDVIVYMVGESIFMDQLVLKVCRETGKPLVLYSGEAYRIIDLKQRRGLERAYYRKVERLYGKLNDAASLVIYNCEMLKNEYETMYPPKAESMIAYNSADCVQEPYEPGESMNITYFGNLGVGRSDVLLETAEILGQIDESLVLDIYGNAPAGYEERFRSCKNIRYNGFVNPEELRQIIGRSDILLHVESFDEKIVPKLKYAFSTKIAQCLCSGRCFVSYAPSGTASSRYLQSVGGAAMVSRREELKELLGRLVSDPVLRRDYAEKALAVGRKNHQKENTARQIREKVERIV